MHSFTTYEQMLLVDLVRNTFLPIIYKKVVISVDNKKSCQFQKKKERQIESAIVIIADRVGFLILLNLHEIQIRNKTELN